MTNRKLTRVELEQKISEQEETNKILTEKLEDLNNYVDSLMINEGKLEEEICKLEDEYLILNRACINLEERTKELKQEVTNRNDAISKLKAKFHTVTMIMHDFYWSPITLKKDILKIIND